ncbi:hypothetical protein FI667_g67, partial [Globisporangium splendens]
MLGLKYVVAKSKELQGKLERSAAGSSSASTTRYSVGGATANSAQQPSGESTASDHGAASSPTSGSRREGETFLKLQQAQWDQALAKHNELLASGERVGVELSAARKTLLDQVESEQFIQENFHLVSKAREQISRMRQKTEEYMAAQNASFAARQQEELELFELRILDEKEDRTRQLLEARRQQLAQAFQNDIKTYQTLVTYQGESLPKTIRSEETTTETLESIDLIVTADAQQLDAFYDLGSDSESDVDTPANGEAEGKSDDEEHKEEEEEKGSPPPDAATQASSVEIDIANTKSQLEQRVEDDEVAAKSETPADANPNEQTADKEADVAVTQSSLPNHQPHKREFLTYREHIWILRMEAKSSHVVVSESELSKSVKNLKTTKGREHSDSDSLEYDSQIADKLDKCHDLTLPPCSCDDSEQELDENPRKALKYPPCDAAEFGKKYAQGFYTYAEAK